MKNFMKNGAAYIQGCIDAAANSETRRVVVTGNYEIEKTILIPSEFTLVLEDCHLRMADDTMCNMFTNAHCRTEAGRTPEGADHDIVIEGRGRAVLDGGKYNDLSERNHSKDGLPHISVNNVLLFTNVENFVVKNLHVRNQRWWALNFVYCRYGKIQDIDFRSNPAALWPDGTYHDRITREAFPGAYDGILVRNSDGIDLRQGCHDILIENITGFTEDDTVALTALNGSTEKMYGVAGLCPDIHNVIIRSVNSAAFCSNVRLLNQGDIKLYNIIIDGVMDSSLDHPYMDRGIYAVRVGDANHMYGSRPSTKEETFNITVRNVYSRAGGAAVHLAGAMKDVTLENIRCFDGCPRAVQNKADIS